MLNQGFLPGGLEASYAVDGGEATGFVVAFDSTSAARRGFAELRDYYAASAGLMNVELPGELSFAARTPYHGVILAFLQGKNVSGALDLEDANKGRALVRSIHEHLAGLQEVK
jgi:hypothetical protein